MVCLGIAEFHQTVSTLHADRVSTGKHYPLVGRQEEERNTGRSGLRDNRTTEGREEEWRGRRSRRRRKSEEQEEE